MRKFRSHTIIHYLTSKAFVLWVPICMLGVFQLAFSHFAFAVDSNPGTPSSEINVDLVNGIAVRILDEAGQQQIDNINLDLIAAPGGSYISGKFNVEVSTSNKTGYKLYMDSSYDQSSVMGTTSPDYTTNLVNQTNTSYVIPTLANNVTLAEFQSGSNNSSNKWGYSLDDATFSPIPVHATPDMVDSLSTPTASTLTPVTIGTNVNMDMASGVYKNQLTFSAVAEPVPTDYNLYFEPGTTDTVTNLPETMTYSGVATSHTFTIPATAPSRTGYNFTGYLDESTSTTYQAGDSITVVGDIDYTGSATLTAQWELAEKTWDTMTAMQDMTTKICNSAGTGATKTLTDTRDNNTYTIKKLKDGKCWMTQNLRLVGSRTLTSADSNVSTNFTLTASNSGTWCTENSAACDDKSMVLDSGNTTYGTYYNWYAATAGTGKYSTSSGNVSSSICPKGWRLPTGDSSGEFRTLYYNYESAALMMGDPAFVLSGLRHGSSTNYQGSSGRFWSSTAYGSSGAYRLRLTSSSVGPGYGDNTYYYKYYGFSVRCVAQ